MAFLDSDNTWTPDFLRLSLAAMTGLLYLALDPPVAQVRRLLRR